jgi:flagellar hook-associated protein FlgK
MSDLLGVSGNAVMAYQRALGTVSNNIANVATDGYSRQDVNLVSGAPRQVGSSFIGTGVIFDRVRRQYDAFAESNLRNSNADLQSQAPMVDYANRVIDVMAGQSMGLVSALDQFFTSARSLSSNPASTVLRGAFMRDAEGLASRFGELTAQLDLVDDETRQAVEASVGEINTLGLQLAQVNKQLSKTQSLDRQPAELLDQRDLLLRNLSDFSRLDTRFEPNGMVTVSLGASITQDVIVQGPVATRIGLNLNAASPEKISLVLDPYGSPRPLSGGSSGQLAGLLAFREQVLGSTRNQLDYLANTLAREVNAVHREGVDGYGDEAGDLFAIDDTGRAAGSLRVALDDPMRIAAAAQFRVIKEANNTGSADARISYRAPSPAGPPSLSDVLVNNAHPSAGREILVDAANPMGTVATVPAGLQNVVIYLDSPQIGQHLQLLTRDGRHVMGSALDEATQARLMMREQGMAAGASYSTSYLNGSDALGYKGMIAFYGARADVAVQQAFDSQGLPSAAVHMPALLAGGRITAGQSAGLPAGALEVNGVRLGALAPAAGTTLQAGDVAAWLNAAGAPGITAKAVNEVRVPGSSLKLDRTLRINNEDITRPAGGFASANDFVAAINAKSTSSGVTAFISADGDLVLTNVSGQEGRDIRIEPGATSGNVLNITADVYAGRVSIERALVSGKDTPIEIGFGKGTDAGTPADLARLGFRTSATIKGQAPDDVLVFVTGNGAASVATSYQGEPLEPAQALRAQPLQVNFTAADRYTITDMRTGTVLAEREFDPAQVNSDISYQGLTLNFSTAPKVGDSFLIDANRDGTGSNENMLRLAEIESRSLIAGKTLGTAYIDHVSEMGNISRQATIAKEALGVVHEQAVAARDQVSGVSLDEEAANLIRFQQAYQASAKVMQIAGTLFDAVLGVR